MAVNGLHNFFIVVVIFLVKMIFHIYVHIMYLNWYIKEFLSRVLIYYFDPFGLLFCFYSREYHLVRC